MRKNHCLKSVQIRSFFWSVFSRIWTENEDLRSNSQYSVRIRDNTDQKKLRIWTLFTQWTWLLILTLIVHQSSLIDCQLFNWPWHCVKSAQIRTRKKLRIWTHFTQCDGSLITVLRLLRRNDSVNWSTI